MSPRSTSGWPGAIPGVDPTAESAGAAGESTAAEAESRAAESAAVESIAATLRHRYLLGYEPPEGKPGWRTIRVDVDRPRDAVPQARKGYYSGA